MSTKKWIIISALAGVLIVGVMALSKPPQQQDQANQSGQNTKGLITAQVPTSASETPPAPVSKAPYVASAPQVAPSPLDSITPPACRTTDRGALVIDPQTREDVELVVSLYNASQALAKLGEACKDAAPQAQQEMKNLYQQFAQYSQAVTQTFPVEEQNDIPVEKLEGVLLKGLHDLRVQYFGAEKACAMYCEEEALTKRMLTMAIEHKQKNPKASTEVAVAYAQNEILRELEIKAQKEAEKAAAQDSARK